MTSNRKASLLPASSFVNDIASTLSRKLIGQPAAIDAVVPYIQMYRALLSPEGRPAGVFLLLGPTGTGKTKTVEALAEVLHDSPKKLLRIDCGEFQMDHEVAKLIGAPPGYLGHRETQPVLTQQKVAAAGSQSCDMSLILFDEIEKAAASLMRLLLGILDKASLRLGDGTSVNFEKTMIFLTSNLGASEMDREINRNFGFEAVLPRQSEQTESKLDGIAQAAARKAFAPEFVNRIDSVITYRPLSSQALAAILAREINILQEHIDHRMREDAFQLEVVPGARRLLLEKGTSQAYGARELKRTLQRMLIQPLASLLAAGTIAPGSRIRAELSARKDRLVFREADPVSLAPAC